jgi:bifunctional non-homologous end joining protein LigD
VSGRPAAAGTPGLELTNVDRVLWPSTGFTKGQLLDYYARISQAMLPHLVDRPLTLGRFPGGVDAQGFAQTECRGRPTWLRTAAIALRDGRVRNFCLAQDLPSLLWIANQGTIELHAFLASAQTLDRPMAVLFDLDPEPPAGFCDAARVALLLRDLLARRNLLAVVKTTGGVGLHVLVPLNSRHGYEQTRKFARAAARELAAHHPDVATSAAHRDRRAGTVLVDWAQNGERRTMVAPYSLRAADVPSVSTPVSWREIECARGMLRFAPHETLARVEQLGDLFEPTLTTVQSLG